MRKLYDEFFHIPKFGKIREKVMLTRVATTVTIVVMCLAAMGFTAYAYFSCNVTSGSNTIKAASFEATVSIITNGNPITVTKDGEVQTADLEAGDYMIELSKGNSTADKGFCVITIGDKEYYTDQIGVDAEKKSTDAVVVFNLRLSESVKISVSSHWGTSVYYGYKDEGIIKNDSDLDLTVKTMSDDGDPEEDTDSPEETTTAPPADTTTESDTSSPKESESTTTPSAETTKPAETTPPETTETSEPTDTTEPSTSTLEPETTPPTQSTETTEPESTESAETETTEPKETQPATENTETADPNNQSNVNESL